MQLYIWEDISPVSSYYRDSGGVVVIASSLEEARAMWGEHVKEYDLHDRSALDTEPDDTINIADGKEPRVWVFMNAGCC